MHIPVMKDEIINIFQVRDGGFYIDATYGGGGHTNAILEGGGCVLGIDKDSSIKINIKNGDEEKVMLINDSFANIEEIWSKFAKPLPADGILADLGFSSKQIDDPARGFSFRYDSPLDMRYDQKALLTAKIWINEANFDELVDVFENYGEERNSKKIAHAIIEQRKKNSINTTNDLIKIIMQHNIFDGKHVATRIFQAIRIRINNEFEDLKLFLEKAPKILKKGGILCIITFHSIEDRIVKNSFKVYPNFNESPTYNEIKQNPRSRSARLRWMINKEKKENENHHD